MCGFLGQFNKPGSAIDAGRLGAALDAIAHRGPDDRATVSGDAWWMGFRRLAILDLSLNARQPMTFEGGRYTLTFNGEIYNFRELREELGDFETRSSGDSEVLGRLLATHGVEQTLPKLRGMFAFAWWDSTERELSFARDPFGIKPLYYHGGEGAVALTLGSELRAIRLAPGAGDDRMSLRALGDCLRWGSVQAPATIYEGIAALEPGCMATWKAGRGVAVQRYFEPRWSAEGSWIRDERELAETVRREVLDSVQAHLISDVPVGVFLSGGLDSTIMCGAMKELGVGRIEAFSIGYEGDAGLEDESDAAARTAAHYGAEFHADKISASDLYDAFGDYVNHLDEPTGDALNVFLVARNAAKRVKVALSGTGADEMFGGYNYYRMIKMAQRLPLFRCLPRGIVEGAIAPAFARLPQSLQVNRAVRTGAYMLGANGVTATEMYFQGKSILRPEAVAKLLRGGGTSGAVSRDMLPGGEEVEAAVLRAAPDSWLHQLLYLETTRYLPNTLLRDSDDMTMAHSLELRVPFVDSRIMALSARTPPDAMLTFRHGKHILREAFRDMLPPWVFEDRKKKTFTLPLMKWLRQPRWRDRVHDVLGSAECRERGLFAPKGVTHHLEAFYASSDEGKRNFAYSQRVWQMFVLESWARENGVGC